LSARIVQAPMANNQPPSLAAVVSNAGALGMVPCAYQAADSVRAFVREVRALTDQPFGLNFFAEPYLDEDALAAAIEERPAVLSFHGGIVDVAPLHDAGIEVFATATTADEARAVADAGVDVIVAQGAEAGGHRGSFLDGFPLVPLAELLQSIDVDVPVLAAGGIVDGDDVRGALELGAAGVQVGTAFLFTSECARPPEHLDALRTYDTVVSDAYTGRPMRAARTPLLEELIAEGPPALPFPEQAPVSRQRGPLYMGGTAARRAREQNVAELVASLTV
jgi:nitronate monooxygenase